MSDRQWAADLADKYENGTYEWIQGAMVHMPLDEPVRCCLLGGINLESKIEYTKCDCCSIAERAFGNSTSSKLLANERITDFGPFVLSEDDDLGLISNSTAIIEYNDKAGRNKSEVIARLREFAAE